MEQLLPLAYHAQEFVIEDKNFYFRTKLHNRSQFLDSHLNSPITNNGNDITLRCTIPCTDSRRKPETHRTKTARGHIRLRLIELCITTSHHLMLSYVRYDDRIAARQFV